jgi:glutamyl-tRNA synthetase
LRKVAVGTIIQFERKGYYICDVAWDKKKPEEPMVFIYIPDGKAKSIGLKADDKTTTVKAPKAQAAKPKEENAKEGKETYSVDTGMYPIDSLYGKISTFEGGAFDAVAATGMYAIKPLVDMNLEIGAQVPKAKKEKKAKKAKAPVVEVEAASPISRLDLVVGKIVGKISYL